MYIPAILMIRVVINSFRVKLTDGAWETLRMLLNDKFKVELATENKFLGTVTENRG